MNKRFYIPAKMKATVSLMLYLQRIAREKHSFRTREEEHLKLNYSMRQTRLCNKEALPHSL